MVNNNKIRLVGILCFVISISFLYPASLLSTDGDQYYFTSKCIIENCLNIDSIGAAINIDVSPNGHYYTKGGFLFPLILAPFVYLIDFTSNIYGTDLIALGAIGKEIAVRILNILLLSGIIYILYKTISETKSPLSGFVTTLCISLVFGTPMYVYATSDLTETLQSLLILLSYTYWFRNEDPKNSLFVFFVLSNVLLILTKPIYILFAIINGLTIIFDRRCSESDKKTKFYSYFFAIFIAGTIYLIYNYVRYDDVFKFGETAGFNTEIITGLHGLLFSPGKSLFLYFPLLLLIVYGVIRCKVFTALSANLLITVTIYLIVYSKFTYWHGDWAWGPRYIIPFIPSFFLLFPFLKFNGLRIGIYILTAIGVLINSLALFVPPSNYIALFQSQIKPAVAQLNPQSNFDGNNAMYFDFKYSHLNGHLWLFKSALSRKLNNNISDKDDLTLQINPFNVALPHPEYASNFIDWSQRLERLIGFEAWFVLFSFFVTLGVLGFLLIL